MSKNTYGVGLLLSLCLISAGAFPAYAASVEAATANQPKALTSGAAKTADSAASFNISAPSDFSPREKAEELVAATEAKKKTHHNFIVNGEFRYLYGQGHMEGDFAINPANGQPFLHPVTGQSIIDPATGQLMKLYNKSMLILPTLRTRLYLTQEMGPTWNAYAFFEDNRVLNDHSQDSHPYLQRAYVEGIKPKFNTQIGRFNYFLGYGNLLDDVIEGARVQLGPNSDYASIFAGAYGNGERRRRGFIATAKKTWGNWTEEIAYLDFKKPNASAQMNRQRVISATTSYVLGKNLSIGYELLKTMHRDGDTIAPYDRGSDHGYIWNVNYKQYDLYTAGTYQLRLRYYKQPFDSILQPTMHALPDPFFKTTGYKGFGVAWDYVVAPGIGLTLEAYDLKNYHDNQLMSNTSQKVLGGSLTVYF